MEDQQATLLKEVSTLSLEKYLSEIVADLTEGLTKAKSSADLFTGVEVTSALFQRFGPQFANPLLVNFLRSISNPSRGSLMALTQEARAKEETTRTDRHKIILRVLIELWLVNVFRTAEDPKQMGYDVPGYSLKKSSSSGILLPLPLSALHEVLNYDMKEYSTASVAIMILKNYGSILLGISRTKAPPTATTDSGGSTPASHTSSTATDPDLVSSGSLVPSDVKDKFTELFSQYVKNFQSTVVELAKTLRRMERRNENAFIKTGKILDQRKLEYDNLMRKAEEMTSNCRVLSDIMNMEMPELRFTNETEEEILIRKGGTIFGTGDVGIWDDDEQRKFYEDLVDLNKTVNTHRESDDEATEGGEDGEGEGEGEEEEEEEEFDSSDEEGEDEDQDMLNELDAIVVDYEGQEEEGSEHEKEVATNGGGGRPPKQSTQGNDEATDGDDDDDDEDDNDNAQYNLSSTEKDNELTAGTQIQALLLTLSERTHREAVDNVAMEFVLNLNNKASRNRLVKFFTEIPLEDEYKLSFYARFIATIDPVAHEVTEKITEYLDGFFGYLQRKRRVKALFGRRMFNLRYFSELTKFGLIPKHVIFNKFKAMTERLDEANAFNLATLLEGCGRYLLRKPQTNVLMTRMIQVLEKQKKARYLSIDQKALVEGAITYVKPPPDAALANKVKHRSTIEKFLRELIYVKLSKETLKPIQQLLMKLDWNDEETYEALKKVFSKIHKVRFSNIPYMAWFLYSFVLPYQTFVVYVIDSTFEQVRRGLEISSYKINQQRLAQVKYLGEIFGYGLIDGSVIYETLYLFLTFGHPKGKPVPGVYAPTDPPDDFFRIRLVCTLLETSRVGQLLDKHGREKLDLFLAFFQYYFFTKEKLSMDIEFQVRDTFKLLRPEMKLHDIPEEAQRALNRAIARANGQEPALEDRPQEEEHVEEKVYIEEEDGTEYDRDKFTVKVDPVREERRREEERQKEEALKETPEQKAAREEHERQLKEKREKLLAQKQDMKASEEIDREFKRLMMDRVDTTNMGNLPSNNTSDKKQQQTNIFDAPVPSTKSSPSTSGESTPKNTVAYSLLTKNGPQQEVKSVNVPSDSSFAISVAQKQQQRRAEHDRVKQSVLKYVDREDVSSSEPPLETITQPEIQRYKYRERNRRG